MLEATKSGILGRRYDITLDGRPVAEWNPSFWRDGGDITLAGQRYRVDAATFTNKFAMRDASGATVATAERTGRKHWTVTADGKPHRFRRTSIWGNRHDLLLGDTVVGSVRRVSIWSGKVEADLPTLSLPVQIFVVGVVLTTWDRKAAAAAASS